MRTIVRLALIVLMSRTPGLAFDFITGNGNGLGQAMMLSRSSASTLLNVPTGGLARGEWRVETGLNRAYDLKELDQAYIAGAWHWRDLTAAIGFSQLGQRDFYSERTAKWGLGYQYRDWMFGANYSVLVHSFGGRYGELSAGALGLGGGFRRAPVYLAFSADNLNSPVLDRGSPSIRPVYSLYAELRSSKTLSTVSRMRFEDGNPPQFAAGQRIAISPVSALMWGLQSAPLQLGGGVEIGVANGRITYTASYHPTLGLSHTIAVSYGSGMKNEGVDGFQ